MKISGLIKNKDAACIFFTIMCGAVFMYSFKARHGFGFLNLDELLWMYRSRFFFDMVLRLDFGGLIQSAQPGIMVMWFAGPFMRLMDFDFTKIENIILALNSAGGYSVINDPARNYYSGYEFVSFVFNIPIIVLMIGFVAGVYYLLRKIGFERRAIFLSLLLISTTPYYFFFTTPTDKLSGIFFAVSFLSLLVYLKKNGKKLLMFSAAMASWAALTKLSAVFLVPFSFFVLISYRLYGYDFPGWDKLQKTIFISMKDFLAWMSVFTVSSVLFLPTIIVNPPAVIKLFFGEKSFGGFMQSSENLSVLGLAEKYLSDSFLLSFNLFIIAIFLAFFVFTVKKPGREMDMRRDIVFICMSAGLYFIFLIFFGKVYSFRYMIPALILFQIISGAGMNEFSKILSRRSNLYSKNETFALAVVFVLISQALLIYYSEIVSIE